MAGRLQVTSSASLDQLIRILLVSIFTVSCVDGYLETYPDVSTSTGRNTTPLYFGLIMSFPGGEFNSSGAIAGVRVALDRINSDPAVLPNHTLHYTLTNSSCNRSIALSALFSQLLVEPAKIALIGSGCSVATEPTAEISQFYNITQISCVSSSTALSDRARFQRYFQLLPSEDTIAPSYYAVIKAFGWRRVSIIEQNENLFTVTNAVLKSLLKRDNITFDVRIFDTEESIAGLGAQPFDPASRIHIITTYSSHARRLLCEAFHRGIKYPQHLLMTPAWYAPRWWLVEDEEYSCTAAERESVLPTSLAFLQFEFLEDLNLTTTTGITGAEYFEEEERHLNQEPFNLTRLEYAQYCYDATWTLAYALDLTISEIEPGSNSALNQKLARDYGVSEPFQIEDFSYDNDSLTNIIFNQVERTSFSGITGNVTFGANGVRNPNMQRVYQFRNITTEDGNVELNWYEVGRVLNNGTNYVYVGDLDIWPDGLIPYDGVPSKEYVTIAVPVTVVYILVAIAGVSFAIVCLIFNFVFRNKRLIRLTSPNLNYLIGFGAIILYLVIFFTVLPITTKQSVAFICNIVPWLAAIGYSLCFGTIVSKMFRIYCIFNNPNAKKRSIKDWMLALMVLAFVVIDLIILIMYTLIVGIIDKDQLGAKEIINTENPQQVTGVLQITTRYCTFVCNSSSRQIFIGILFGYKALLQVLAMVFAFSIRKVKVKGLNDTKYIVAIVYVTSLATAVIILSIFIAQTRINSFAALFSTGVFIGATVTIGLIFIPKMISLYQDPEGNTVFGKNIQSMPSNTTHGTQNVETLKTRITELENLVETLKEKSVSVKDNNEKMEPEHETKFIDNHTNTLEKLADEDPVPVHTIWDVDNNNST